MDIIRLAEGIFFNKKKNVLFIQVIDKDVIYYKRINGNFVCVGSIKHGKDVKISDEFYDNFIADKLYLARQKLSELRIAA